MSNISRCIFALALVPAPLALADGSLSNVVLIKEFPMSVQVRHEGGQTFVPKAGVSSADLEALKHGKVVANLVEASPEPSINRPEQLTSKSLAEYLRSNLSNPVKQKPSKGFTRLENLAAIGSYPQWKPEEVVAFNSWHNKRHLAKYRPSLNYTSTGELIVEAAEDSSAPPPAHSNRQFWESKGLKARKQDGSNCSLFSHTMAGDVLLIKEGFKSPKADPNFLWKAQPIRNDRYEAQGDLSLAEGISSNGIFCSNNKHQITRPLEIRNIHNLKKDPSDFPLFVRKLFSANPDKDLQDGCFKSLLKREISLGRPVILDFPFPDGKIFDKQHKRDGKQEIIIRPKVYAGRVNPHSVLAVGYKPDPEDPDQLLIEILNTAGPLWGNDGYAWVSTAYLDLFRELPTTTAAYSVDLSPET